MEGKLPVLWIVVCHTHVFVWANSSAIITYPDIIAMLGEVWSYGLVVWVEKPCATNLEESLHEKDRIAVLYLAKFLIWVVNMPQIKNIAVFCDYIKRLKFQTHIPNPLLRLKVRILSHSKWLKVLNISNNRSHQTQFKLNCVNKETQVTYIKTNLLEQLGR